MIEVLGATGVLAAVVIWLWVCGRALEALDDLAEALRKLP